MDIQLKEGFLTARDLKLPLLRGTRLKFENLHKIHLCAELKSKGTLNKWKDVMVRELFWLVSFVKGNKKIYSQLLSIVFSVNDLLTRVSDTNSLKIK